MRKEDPEHARHGGSEGAKEPKARREGRENLTGKVSTLPCDGWRPRDYSDTVRRGLRLRVSPRRGATRATPCPHAPCGERIFLLAYRRPRDGKGVKLSIGSLAEGMSLAKARSEAADLQDLLRREPPIDPAEERSRRREEAQAEATAIRFTDVCDAYMAEELPTFRPASRSGWRRYIEKEIKPVLGPLKPDEVTAQALAELRDKIARGIPGKRRKDGSPTWKRKPAPVSARKCFEVVRRIFGWLATADSEIAVVRKRHGIDRLEHNPAEAVRSFRRKRRAGKTRAAASAKAFTDDQLRAIFTAAEARVTGAVAARMGRESRSPNVHEVEARSFRNQLVLVAHTAVRAHDARAGRVEELDEVRKLWTIPQHKTSDHTGAPHVVPLSEGALRAIAAVREANLAAGYGKSEWMFPAVTEACEVCERKGHADKDSKATKRIMTAAGIKGRGILHRLRDTIKTRMSEHGIDGRVSEAVLGHVPPGIVGTYDHAELLRQRREALAWWSEELAKILSPMSESATGPSDPAALTK